MNRKIISVLCCLLLWAGAAAAAESQPAINELGQPLVSDFTLPSADGGVFRLSDHRGEKVILGFWASWCEYSGQEMPLFQKLYDEQPGVTIWMVSLADGARETRETAQAFFQAGGYTLPLAYDEDASVYALFPGNGELPMTVLIDENGYLADVVQGQIDEARLWGMAGETANVQPALQH